MYQHHSTWRRAVAIAQNTKIKTYILKKPSISKYFTQDADILIIYASLMHQQFHFPHAQSSRVQKTTSSTAPTCHIAKESRATGYHQDSLNIWMMGRNVESVRCFTIIFDCKINRSGTGRCKVLLALDIHKPGDTNRTLNATFSPKNKERWEKVIY